MTQVLFAFDTEDFTSPTAAAAILEEAKILEREGVKGAFNVVGLLAQQLESWGRQDIIEALKYHELGCHSYGHTLHPMLNEYTDIEDFDAAKKEVLRQESEALEMIAHATNGQKVYAACPPGNQKSYVGMYAYAQMGLPIYADTFCDTPDGQGVHYCNQYHVRYTFCMEQMQQMEPAQLPAILDELAKHHRAICYAHPNMALYKEFWDAVNYQKVNKYPFGQWEEGARLPEQATKDFYEKIRTLVRLIKEDPRFEIICYSDLARQVQQEGRRCVTTEDIPLLAQKLKENFYPVTEPVSLCLSDLFLACRQFLLGEKVHSCGHVYGFLDKPFAIEEPVTVTASQMKTSAEKMDVSGFLPTAVLVGENTLGPGDWLRAAMAVLLGEESVTIYPGAQLPSLDALPELRDCALKGTWMHGDDFEDKYLSERLRLQAWTMRF